jgi:urease accessory protein
MNPAAPRLLITERLPGNGPTQVQLVLPFHQRQKSRLLTRLSDGEEVGLMLDRGTLLRGGDRLLCSDGRSVAVVAAPETLSIVTAGDPWQLARVAYHLGNRHIDVQVGVGWLGYLHDHVLDDMVRGLGFKVTLAELPFEPEAGAYAHAGAAHSHGHAHDPAPGNGHAHAHAPGHSHG